MKKISLILFFAATMFASCSNNSYTLQGTVANADFDGTTVYVAERIARVWQNLDSAVVENGKFRFTGENDSTRIVFLKFNYAGSNSTQPFVLEPGTINLAIDASGKISISGTKENDILNEFNQAEADLYKRADEAREAFEARGASQEEMEAESQKYLDEYKTLIVDYASKYANTIAGDFLFLNSYYYLSVAEKDAIIAHFNDKTKEKEAIKKVIQAVEVEKKVAEGNPFVDFTQNTPTGESLALSSLVGQTDYLLIDFWASWCGPCIRSFPELKEFYNTNKGSKFEILGVSLDDDSSAWKDAIAQYELIWHHVSDLKGWDNEAAKLYAVSGIPHTVLIDKNGKIVGHNMTLTQIKSLLSSDEK